MFSISIVTDEVIPSGAENCKYVTIAADEATDRALKWLFKGFEYLFIVLRTE